MENKWKNLSATQARFTEYVNENIKQSNRIILYMHNGHFGLEFAILSRYKNAKLLNYKELKAKTGKNIMFRIIHIAAACISCILNHFKVVDTRTTISSMLSNMENIYLGIDKQREYLKYLKIKKIPRKNGKIKYFIRIEECDIESDDDMHCLKLMCKLIEKGNINNTVLLISGKQLSFSHLTDSFDSSDICLFELTSQDLKFIADQINLKLTESASQNIDLVKKLGLQFFKDNYMYFNLLSDCQAEKYDWIQKIEWIIKQILQRGEIAEDKIYPLLEFGSFFESNFSKLDIKNFKNDELDADNLNVAYKLALISQKKTSIYSTPIYWFDIESFKLYFTARYSMDLEPMPQYIYEYFRNKFPFDYLPSLNVLRIDSSFVENITFQSLIIIGFYFQNYEIGIDRQEKFICLTTKDSTTAKIINLHESFKKGFYDEQLKIDIESIVRSLTNNMFDAISTCAGYVIILQYIKENEIQFDDSIFDKLMNDFRNAILDIEIGSNYDRYWVGHFKCQYIALSLENENAKTKTSRIFLKDIQKLKEDENFSMYISNNKLRGFSRINLLAFSLAYDNAGEILKDLYISSEESSIIKELARINYSAYLIENQLYREAQIVLKKANDIFLKNINEDTYCSYLNNLYIAQLGEKDIDIDCYISSMVVLMSKSINFNDKYIIENNLSVGYLMQGKEAEKGIERLEEHINSGNPYNQFLAIHNLLSYYFINNESGCFNKIYNRIVIPKLLLSDKTFFLNKFEWMKQNIGLKTYDAFQRNRHVTACYNEPYIISSLERWFE